MFRRKSSYTGKVAIVTGGASGIGRALCHELARRGAEVVVADRDAQGARDVAKEITDAGHQGFAEELDVRDLGAFEQVVTRTVARSGRVDYLFNNAGIGIGGEADGYAPEDWDDVLDVNLRGVTNGVQAVYAQMIAQKTGHIVNTASVLGLVAPPGQVSYTAAKHGVVGLSRALRVEARTHGVSVSVLCPGAVWTPILTGGRYGHAGYDGMREEIAKKLWATAKPIQPRELAQRALDAVARDEAIIVVPSWWRAVWLLDRLAPSGILHAYRLLLAMTRRDIAREGLVRASRASARRAAAAGGNGDVAKARRPMSN